MSKHILFVNNVLHSRYDSDINGDQIPPKAIEVSDELFFETINDQDGVWSLVKGKIKKLPFPEPTEEELASQVRAQRDLLLRTDVDSINPVRWQSMSKDQQKAWVSYRQDLLNVTNQKGFPKKVTWPVAPKDKA